VSDMRNLHTVLPTSLDIVGLHIPAHMSEADHGYLVDLLVSMKPALTKPRTCVWSPEIIDNYWRGSCGIVWQCEFGTPSENGMNYCPRCGAKLEQAKETTQ